MVDYNPHNINQMYEQYSKSHSSSSSSNNSGSTYDEVPQTITQGLGSPLSSSFNKPYNEDNNDTGGVQSFLENAWSWLSASGGEPEKPKVYDGSSVYDRSEFDPARYTKPINFSDQDKRINDMLNNRDDDPGYKDDEYAGNTYDEVKKQEGVEEYRSTKARAEGINNAIKGIMDTEQRQDAIRNAVNKTIDSLRSANPTVDYVIQAGDTLSSIAAKTGTTVEDLVKANKIQNKNEIFTGDDLIIPTDKTTKTKEDVVSSLIGNMSSGDYLNSISGKEGSNFEGEGIEVADNRSLVDTLRNLIGLGGDEDIGGYDEIPDFVPKTEEEIIATQKVLDTAGYYSGKLAEIDGLKGKNYFNAIKSLQHNNGLEVTGEINTETARVIRRGDFVKNSRPADPLLAFISSGEGGYGAANNGNSDRLKKKGKLFSIYDSYYSEKQSKPLQSMTIKEILRAQIGKPNASMDEIKKHFEDQTNDKGKYIYTGKEMDNREFFAVGAYQIIPPTMMAVVNSMSLTGEEVYTPQLQDKIARDFLAADKRPTLNAYLKGSDKVTVEDAMDDAAKEWASLPTQEGLGYYDGQNAAHTAAEAKEILENAQAEYIIDNIGIAR